LLLSDPGLVIVEEEGPAFVSFLLERLEPESFLLRPKKMRLQANWYL